jgi:hypothetical protein
MRHRWVYVALTLLVGLSFALPVFLFAREGKAGVTRSSHLVVSTDTAAS